jgi:hypothetical protein
MKNLSGYPSLQAEILTWDSQNMKEGTTQLQYLVSAVVIPLISALVLIQISAFVYIFGISQFLNASSSSNW